MDLNREMADHSPHTSVDPMGTPADDETVLWQGQPDLRILARTAFHTRTIGIYFAALTAIALAVRSVDVAMFVLAFGLVTLALLYTAAWLTVRNTRYILTDTRIIMRIGMAVDKRVNIPLKKVVAANLADRGAGFGDIAFNLGEKTVLGYLLLWPHARPWKLSKPQPMLRALPNAAEVAAKLADATANYNAITRGDFISAEERHPSGISAGEFSGAAA